MPRCVIFTAGDQHGIEKHEIGLRHDDFVICCDAGYRLAQRLGVRPDLLLGDFDSYTGALPEDIPVQRYIRDKDDTDTVIAVRYALEHGYDSILLVAATGGRLDHLLGNLQILAFISEKAPGTAAEILGSHERVWLLDGGSLSIQGKPESTFSVLCHSDRAEGVTIRGARFGLENAVMTNRFPLGISNRIGEERIATISVEKGILFVIYPLPSSGALPLLGGCTAGNEESSSSEPESQVSAAEPAAGGITEEEAVERVRELLISNSQKLCTTDENIAMLQNSQFTCEGTVTVEDTECWLVKKGTGSYAVSKDGEHLYEWQEVTGSYAPIQ